MLIGRLGRILVFAIFSACSQVASFTFNTSTKRGVFSPLLNQGNNHQCACRHFGSIFARQRRFARSATSHECKSQYVPDRSESTQRLLSWLFDEIQFQGSGLTELGYSLDANDSKDGSRRGMFATKDHDEGEYMFAIPMDAAIEIEQDETNDAKRGLKLLNLLQTQEKTSWGPYFDTLPSDSAHEQFSPTPDYWSDDGIYSLQVPRIINAALERKIRIRDLAETENVGLEELKFSTWLVESRSFNIVKDMGEDDWEEEDDDTDDEEEDMSEEDLFEDLQTRCVLVPYLDMINHSSDDFNAALQVLSSEAEDEGEIVDYLAVVATRQISSGEEILISYGTGADTSVDLLLHYGFVPEKNENDEEMYEYSNENGDDDLFYEEKEFGTTLEDDERRLKERLTNGDKEMMALKFRVRMKRALREWRQKRRSDS